jgi:hypothetical protein
MAIDDSFKTLLVRSTTGAMPSKRPNVTEAWIAHGMQPGSAKT